MTISYFLKLNLLALAVSLAACGIDPKAVPTIACSFANVLVAQTDIPKLDEAFGDDSAAGSRVCKAIGILLTGDDTGASEPAEIDQITKIDFPLPSGEIIEVTLAPRNQ